VAEEDGRPRESFPLQCRLGGQSRELWAWGSLRGCAHPLVPRHHLRHVHDRSGETIGADGGAAPVAPEVFAFEVSGLKVVQSWLNYRMKSGAGRKSSPLDDIRPEVWTSQFTTELLELLWVLAATIAGYPKQAELLESIVSGDCFTADEIPSPPDWMRKPPRPEAQERGML